MRYLWPNQIFNFISRPNQIVLFYWKIEEAMEQAQKEGGGQTGYTVPIFLAVLINLFCHISRPDQIILFY